MCRYDSEPIAPLPRRARNRVQPSEIDAPEELPTREPTQYTVMATILIDRPKALVFSGTKEGRLPST